MRGPSSLPRRLGGPGRVGGRDADAQRMGLRRVQRGRCAHSRVRHLEPVGHLVLLPKASVHHAAGQEPAAPVIQAGASGRAARQSQQGVFERAKARGEVVQDQDVVVMALAQLTDESQPGAPVGRAQQVGGPVEGELVEDENLVSQSGSGQDRRAVPGGEDMNKACGIVVPQALKGRGDGEQVADVRQLDDQPPLWRPGRNGHGVRLIPGSGSGRETAGSRRKAARRSG